MNDDDNNDNNPMDDTEMTTFQHDNDIANAQPIYMLPPSTTALHTTDDNDDDDMDFQDAPQKRKRYASGLANLGNTCFMNSTLQCLAHTDPLRRYFVTSEYQADLNQENTLGTGGELAEEFAHLLKTMWITKNTVSDVVYPRQFKAALGRNAEQFLGYDQHDSQEFATYLLDALHEDTNRITKKPYIEKPEQKEDETDDEAAEVAWKLHLRREDSRVLENFMGQVKSRVQCPTEGCGRVSTTFDPFMYLSVPIPGATDITIPVTLASLHHGNYTFHITLNKTATMEALQKSVANKWKERMGLDIDMQNMICVDIWSNKVYGYHKPTECVDKIMLERDVTYIYELKSVEDVTSDKNKVDTGDNALAVDALESKRTYRRHKLDVETLTELNQSEKWIDALSRYTKSTVGLYRITNAKRTSHEERVEYYQKLEAFIDLCHASSDGKDSEHNEDAEMAATKEENPQEETKFAAQPKEDSLPSLEERCATSRLFRNVKEVKDLAILEYCSKMLRNKILRLLEESTTKYDKEGIVIQVVMRQKSAMRSPNIGPVASNGDFSVPLCLRLSSKMTVYGLREELASRLSNYLKTDYLLHKPPPPPPLSEDMDTKIAAPNVTPDESNEGSDQSETVPMEMSSIKANGEGANQVSSSSGSSFDLDFPELLIMRQIPLTFNREEGGFNKGTFSRQLGMLDTFGMSSQDGHLMTLANKDDDAEQHTIAEVVGNMGTVQMNWTQELCNRTFDVKKYEEAVTVEDPEAASRNTAKKIITVKDCIDKYCHMEQLDETEMWYCNRCKDHVRAWKQFHLYRSPPILIVHLKRFHYSSSTHRRDKIDTFIDFPLTGLDLTNEFTHWTDDEKPIYDCYAVSNHFGGLGGGHYTAFALSDEGTWSNFDDSRVTTDVDPKDVVSSAAYVLYYRRRDVVLDGPEGEVNPPVPAIVHDSYFQPQEESHDRLDMDFQSMDAEMHADLNTDIHSTTSSNKSCSSQMDSVDIDPYENNDYELGNFKSNLPSQ